MMRLYWQRCSSLLVLYVLSWQSTAFFISAQKDASTLNQWSGFSTRHRQRNARPVARTLVSASATRTIPADKQNINLTTTTTTLNFWEHMICGATARSLAKTMFHPANVAKTILQTSSSAASPSSPAVVATLLSEKPSQVASSSSSSPVTLMSLVRNRPRVLLRGTAAQFILSAIQGAVTFAIVEETRHVMERTWQQNKQQPATQQQQQQQASTRPTSTTTAASMDFASSVVSTAAASIVSVPQMVIMDNLMAGNYPHLGAAVTRLYQERGGIGAFYRNWGPHLMGKIPAYAFTWVFFQQCKRLHRRIHRHDDRPPTAVENTCMGFMASAASVFLMMPVEVVKTRIVTQSVRIPYRNMADGFVRVVTEEGWPTLYRGLVPRLVSVVPMTGVSFGIYESLKRVYLENKLSHIRSKEENPPR